MPSSNVSGPMPPSLRSGYFGSSLRTAFIAFFTGSELQATSDATASQLVAATVDRAPP